MNRKLENNLQCFERREVIKYLGLLWVSFLLDGCATPTQVPYVAKPTSMPAPAYCFDSVGHIPGSKPFILGGTCCCTPTKELMDKYHADGLLLDMQLKDLLSLYESAGIKTALDHHGCNNLCQWGPHVIKGGKCMAPPTPGTFNFEEVRFGIRYAPAPTSTAKK